MAASVFTYGTLLFAEVMTAVAGRAYAATPATLGGFARVCVRDAVYPGAVEEAGAEIRGVLYRDVDEAALVRLDRFEGEMYERRRVTVTCDDDPTETVAYVYLVMRAHQGRLDRRPWDPERFRRDHLASYLALCRAGDVAEVYRP